MPFVAEPGSKNKLSKRKIAAVSEEPGLQEGLRARPGHRRRRSACKTSADTFNPVIVDFYREVGYLPDAILNYLVLLGWSLDDKTEDFTPAGDDPASSRWSGSTRLPASFDVKKLFAFQEHYMPQLPVEEKVARVAAVPEEGWPVRLNRDCLPRNMQAARDRIKVAGDILDYA